MSNEDIKKACKQICDEPSEFLFKYIFGKKLIIGTVMDVSHLGIIEGSHNNMMGNPSSCASIYYRLILLNALQIKEILKYSPERLVYEISTRLEDDKNFLATQKAAVDFHFSILHEPGNA